MSDYLDRVEAQLTQLTEQGAHRRLRARRGAFLPDASGNPRPPRRRYSEALALVAAFAVAAAVVLIVVLNVGTSPHQGTPAASRNHTAATTTTSTTATTSTTSKTSTTSPTTTTSPRPGTVPATPTPPVSSQPLPRNFHPQSFTAISELTWWLLGPKTCSGGGLKSQCAQVLRTTDGGRSFVALPASPAPLFTPGQVGVSQLRFADAADGFAYGNEIYSTHDGGRSWHPVFAGGAVPELAISAGRAFAVVQTPKHTRLMTSPVNRDHWTIDSAAGDVSGGLWVQGADVLVQSGAGTGIGANVLVSRDGGQSFSAHPAPSPGLPCQFAAPDPPVVWAHCATGTESGVWRSTDFGAHFSPAETSSNRLMLPNSAAFAAASATTAVAGYNQLYRTTNAGASWTPVGPAGIAQWAYLGFTDATHGVALGYVGSIAPANERLYYTTDGGQSYHLVALP